MIKDGDKLLVTSDVWFYGADGEQYRAVYGTVKKVTFEEMLGFKPRRSENWALQIGNEKDFIIIAGCQIHCFLKTSVKPKALKEKYIDKDTGLENQTNRILFLD